MKPLSKSLILSFVVSSFIIIGCSKEIDDPYNLDCPKELFTPTDFKAEQIGSVIILNWKQVNGNIDGFIINRSINDGKLSELKTTAKSVVNWNDSTVVGGTKYIYQLYAYAGANRSNPVLVSINTRITEAKVFTIMAATNLTSNSVVLGGDIKSDEGSPVIERGICYGTIQNPSIGDTKVIMGTGIGKFNNTIKGLAENTTYYAKAYAINSIGTSYGETISFTTLIEGKPNPNWVTVDGGIFLMNPTNFMVINPIFNKEGSYSAAKGEVAHNVKLSSFLIGQYEVTFSQYIEFLNAIKYSWEYEDSQYGRVRYFDIGYGIKYDGEKYYFEATTVAPSASCPVIVGWYGANAFCRWVGGRLPTEAEWEFAARGGVNSKGYYFSGSKYVGDVAWYSNNSDGKYHPVGLKQPNELNIYDMSGNANEWCSDWYETYYSQVCPFENPQGPDGPPLLESYGYLKQKVIRGGYWWHNWSFCLVVYRSGSNTYADWPGISGSVGAEGFRVARSLR